MKISGTAIALLLKRGRKFPVSPLSVTAIAARNHGLRAIKPSLPEPALFRGLAGHGGKVGIPRTSALDVAWPRRPQPDW